MADYLSPRRFSRIFEMDRNGPPMCGTLEEQRLIRGAISEYAEWNNLADRALFAVTKKVKSTGRHFIPISMWYDPGRLSIYGRTMPALIQIFPPDRPTNRIPQSEWAYVFWHEFGHLINWWMFPTEDNLEGWATQFQWWVMNGQNPVDPVWQRLEPLCPTVVVP